MDVRSGEHVDAAVLTADQPAQRRGAALSVCVFGVEVSGVDYPERIVRSRGLGTREVRGVVAHRNRDDGFRTQPGKGLADPHSRLARRHHHGGGRLECTVHPPEVGAPVQSGGVDRHLVERPGVAQVCDPGLSGDSRKPHREIGRSPRRHEDVDHVRSGRGLAARLHASLNPPASPRRVDPQPALEPGPLSVNRRLCGGDPMNRELGWHFGFEALVLRRPAAGRGALAGQDARLAPVLR